MLKKTNETGASGIGAMKGVSYLVLVSGSFGGLTSYIPIKPKYNLALTTVVLFEETVVLRYKTSCKNCRIEQPAFCFSLIMMLMLANSWKS